MTHWLDVRKNIIPRRPPDTHLAPFPLPFHLAPFPSGILCRQTVRGLLVPRGYLTSFPTPIATFELCPWHRPFLSSGAGGTPLQNLRVPVLVVLMALIGASFLGG